MMDLLITAAQAVAIMAAIMLGIAPLVSIGTVVVNRLGLSWPRRLYDRWMNYWIEWERRHKD